MDTYNRCSWQYGFQSCFRQYPQPDQCKISIDISNDIQADIFDQIVDADWLALNNYTNGDILNRFTGDVGTISGNAISWLPSIVLAIYNFVATFCLILYYDWVMAIFAFGTAPLMLIMSRFVIKKQRDYNKKCVK